jgi:hypothetical protein
MRSLLHRTAEAAVAPPRGRGVDYLSMKVRAERKQAFLDAMVGGLTPEGAAKSIGVDRATACRCKADDAVFAVRWDEARGRKVEAKAVEGDLGAICFSCRRTSRTSTIAGLWLSKATPTRRRCRPNSVS